MKRLPTGTVSVSSQARGSALLSSRAGGDCRQSESSGEPRPANREVNADQRQLGKSRELDVHPARAGNQA